MIQVHFGSIDSWDDLDLFLPDDGLKIRAPEPRRILADVPGMNGQLDLTYGLGSEISYRNRTIELDFVMKNYQYQWDEVFADVVSKLHGKRFKVLIDPETDWYLDAFCTVNDTQSDRNKGIVKVSLDCYPYRRKDITLSTTATTSGATVSAAVTEETIVPSITCTASITIKVDNTDTFSFVSGTHKDLEMRLSAGTHSLLVKGSGTVTITYKDGKM